MADMMKYSEKKSMVKGDYNTSYHDGYTKQDKGAEKMAYMEETKGGKMYMTSLKRIPRVYSS